jgi:hypothetical protein
VAEVKRIIKENPEIMQSGQTGVELRASFLGHLNRDALRELLSNPKDIDKKLEDHLEMVQRMRALKAASVGVLASAQTIPVREVGAEQLPTDASYSEQLAAHAEHVADTILGRLRQKSAKGEGLTSKEDDLYRIVENFELQASEGGMTAEELEQNINMMAELSKTPYNTAAYRMPSRQGKII